MQLHVAQGTQHENGLEALHRGMLQNAAPSTDPMTSVIPILTAWALEHSHVCKPEGQGSDGLHGTQRHIHPLEKLADQSYNPQSHADYPDVAVSVQHLCLRSDSDLFHLDDILDLLLFR